MNDASFQRRASGRTLSPPAGADGSTNGMLSTRARDQIPRPNLGIRHRIGITLQHLPRRDAPRCQDGFKDRLNVRRRTAMTPRISLVAVCCSNDSFNSLNSRTFSMAITA